MGKHLDLLITWPKHNTLEHYLGGLRQAVYDGLVINYRIAKAPRVGFMDWAGRNRRCYIVHDGFVRGYNTIMDICERDNHEVLAQDGGWWPSGIYIVRDPHWHAVDPVPHKGFQGWRYYTYPATN